MAIGRLMRPVTQLRLTHDEMFKDDDDDDDDSDDDEVDDFKHRIWSRFS
jgi:hypothetical protein